MDDRQSESQEQDRSYRDDSDPEEAIYEKREFDEPTEPSELDMLSLRGSNVPPDDGD
jgi:hypothetical protein